jgi:hypothetical protein
MPKSNAGIKGGYNLAAVNYDGSGETGQRQWIPCRDLWRIIYQR